MKVHFSVVPPGGGENDYNFEAEMPAIPNAGDYVFKRDFEQGQHPAWAAFIVRRRWFWPQEPVENENILVEVEVARYAQESESHKANCQMYEQRGRTVQRIQDSTF